MANEFVARRGLIAQNNSEITGSFRQGAAGNTTPGIAAHAEGINTVAQGNYSHAEGQFTSASADISHAEGFSTNATGYASHAEGYLTIASGDTSHAEGRSTTAQGNYSHAEGQGTQASGQYSHAEGLQSQAIGDYSHAEGNSTFTGTVTAFKAGDDASISSGVITINSGYGDLTAVFVAGNPIIFSDIDYNNNYGITTFIIDTVVWDSNNTIITLTDTSVNTSEANCGDLKFTTAWGGYGGDRTIAPLYAHTEGESTNAFGNSSHAEGYQTVAGGNNSHAEGYQTTAAGPYSHAEGQDTQALGVTSHAEGVNTLSIGDGSHAEGRNTKSSGIYSHAEGQGTVASGSYSHAEGYFTTASGDYSHAEGWNTQATNTYAHAEGRDTIASGEYSHAEGRDSVASERGAHAEGGSTANGAYSHAEGASAIATGDYSHAEGSGTNSVGPYSHAEGDSTIANGTAAHAAGYYTSASGNYQSVIGQYNVSSTNQSAFIIGNGTAEGSRSNLLFASGSNVQVTGSLRVTAGITGSLFGTSSWAVSASWAPATTTAATASFVTGSNVYGPYGSNSIISASYAVSSSRAVSSSYAISSSFATNATNATSASYARTASYAPAYLPLTGGTVSGNLTVIGTASFAYTTASIVQVGSNIINLNTNNPATRFGGISVTDSGSFGNNSTGSLFWDSLNNKWIYSNPSGSTYSGGMLISGPRNTGSLGEETGMDANFIAVGQGSDHIRPGSIYNSGSGNTAVTQISGSLVVVNSATSAGINTYNASLYDYAGATSINYSSRITYDSLGDESINWNDRILSTVNGTVLDWNVGYFEGTASFATTASYIKPLVQDVKITGSLDTNGINRSILPDLAGAGGITGKILSYVSSPYGIVFRGYSGGAHSIQVQREANDAELFPLSLQPNGGNVAIAKITANAKLDVSGSATISGSFTVTPGTVREFQVNTTGVDIGNLITDAHTVTGSLNVSGSITGSLFGTASYARNALTASTAIFTPNAFTLGGSPFVGYVPYANGNLTLTGTSIYYTGGNLAINKTTANAKLDISGSTLMSGSLRGQVNALSIASNTASIDLSSNNFFTISLVNGANTHISASNIQPGQTVNLRVSQSSAGTGTVTFNSAIEQPSGSRYTGSMIANAEDIVTFISFDSTRLYASAIRNLV